MPRILKNIRIDEVSACTKGAGVGTKIVLMKRDTSGDDFDEWHREQAAIAERQNEEHVRKHDEHEERVRTAARERFLENLRNPSETAKSFVAAARRDNADRHDEEVSVEDTIAEKDDGGGNDHHASRVADLLVESGTATDRKQALAWLLHHKDGAALLRRLKKQHQEFIMTPEQMEAARVEKLKSLNAVAVAKVLVADNDAHGITEPELVEIISNHDRQPGESAAKCFARHFEANTEDGAALRKAVQIAKEAMSLTPFVVGGEAVNPNDAHEAYEQLMQLAEEQRSRAPWKSVAQAFADVFQDPKNAELAAKAHQRPGPTTTYPFPR